MTQLRIPALPLLVLALTALGGCYEGKEVGECFDGKDNDADGEIDCADLGCETYCSDADDDDADDDTGDDDGGDDDGSDDDVGDDDSGDDDVGDDDTGPPSTSIQDLQQGVVPEYTIVTVQGAVTTTGLSAAYSTCGWKSFWIQDPAGGPYSGIMVGFETAGFPPNFSVTPGDAVTLTGEYREYYDASEIILAAPGDLTVTSHPGVPSPVAIGDPCAPALAEPFEGVLVQVTNLTVTQTIANLGFGEFEVNGCLRVDDFMFDHTPCEPLDTSPDPPLNQAITSITAPLHYAYKDFKLVPDGAGAFQGWTP